MKKLIKNGTIVTAVDEFVGDILICDGKISTIGQDLNSEDAEVIDATGKYILPGGVDQHTHFAFNYKGEQVRGFETSNAAAAGGTTTVIDFVNQEPGKSIIDSIKDYDEKDVRDKAMVDYSFHGIVFEAGEDVYNEIPRMPEAGVPTLKLFMAYKGMPFSCDDEAVFRALQASKDAGVTIMVHAENADVIDVLQKQCLAKGETGPYGHALSRPPLVEIEATQRAINLAKLAGAPLYVVHVTAQGAMEAIRDASNDGFPIYGETCTHYLVLDTENLAKPDFEGGKYVCSPALRGASDREALWQAIDKGWLNAVSSDHCGFDFAKQKHMGIDDFTNIPNGCPGVQDRLGVFWTTGVATGRITPSKLVDLFATTPAKVNGIDHVKGNIAPGYDADIVIYDPNGTMIISNDNRLHGVDFDPYEGFEQSGKVDKVLLRGEIIVDDGVYIGKMGQGHFVKGKPFGLAYDTLDKDK